MTISAQPQSQDDPVSAIITFNHARDQRALPRKYQAMTVSPFAFFRATAHLFYAHAANFEANKGLPASPQGWICGDLHVENFGVFRSDNRLNYFDVNDFDEACFGPLSADLVRLGASILLACAELNVSPDQADALIEQAFAAYQLILEGGKAIWSEAEIATGAIKTLFDQIANRKRVDFLDRRTKVKGGKRKIICDDSHYRACTKEDETPAAIAAIFAKLPAREPNFYDIRDIAFRIAGLGSLGLKRYAILVYGRGDPDKNALFDLKASAPSSAASLMPHRQPRWPSDASRVVTLQKRLQAMPANALSAATTSENDYVLRELQPSEDRLDLAILARHKSKAFVSLTQAFNHMAEMAAAMHLRGAAREGADGPDILIEYGKSADRAALLAACKQFKALNDTDYAQFKTAYLANDARFTAAPNVASNQAKKQNKAAG
eukprot:gene11644-11739_t